MLENRVMPCLLMIDSGLYKTVQFKKPGYVGDPINAIKIFNDKEVDELVFLDITATEKKKEPNFKLIEDIASECFMPLAYGGGISTLDQAKRIYEIGVEKIALNNAAIHNPKLIEDIANIYGSQAVIVSIDYKKNVWGKVLVHGQRGKKSIGKTPEVLPKKWSKQVLGSC
jgi:cyclase